MLSNIKLVCITAMALIGIAIPAAAQEDWYLVHATGVQPKRAVYFADLNSGDALSDIVVTTTKSLRFVYVAEEPGQPQYSSARMEFKCGGNEMRMIEQINYSYQNTTERERDTPWQPATNPMLQRFKKIVCNTGEVRRARAATIDASGNVSFEAFNAELKKRGMPDSILPMTSSAIPDLDTLIDVLWTVLWKSQRPSGSSAAKTPGKGGASPGAGGERPGKTDNKTADAYYAKGNEFFDKSLWNDAIENYTLAIKANPRHDAAYANRGIAHIRTGNFDKAMADLNKSMLINPKSSLPYFNLGYIFAEVGAYDEALKNYSKAVELNPNDLSSYFNRGLIYFEQKHLFELAEADFNKVLQGDPQYANGYFVRADLYESWGKDSQANADRKKFQSLGGDALPGFENRRRSLYPGTPFDKAQAESALGEGNSTLIGRACVYHDKTKFDASGARVVLYPVTPYLQKWYDLREKREDKKTGVYINAEAAKYTRIVQANNDGKFVFSRIKPGKYFLQIIYNLTLQRSYTVYTGSDYNTDYYAIRNYYVPKSDRLEKFVEIKNNGDTEKVTMKNKFALLGCKDMPF